jgi:hypothetical protein
MKKGDQPMNIIFTPQWVEVRSGRQRLHIAELLERVAFLAEHFPQTGEEG